MYCNVSVLFHINTRVGRTQTESDWSEKDMALMTVAEVAKETGLKEPTIRKMIAARRLESVKLGRAVRIHAKAVEDLIRLNTVPARVEHRG